ncbi:putative Ig domain-containing protein [Leucobacter luti]|uniref:Putative Ig domain-containing protein n=1 Tax=Leucobacter luti TaxID=340320 RepID=A0A4R6S365_9MICO|nr:putative Ig domain-containing protein [Leucobacter luti]
MALAATLLAGIAVLSSVGPATPAQAVGALEEIPFPSDEGLGGTPDPVTDAELGTRRTNARADEPSPNDPITFPDPVLRSAIGSEIGVSSGTITYRDLSRLQTLKSKGSGITDLSGLEFAKNLSSLYVDNNGISSLAPLSNLTGLRQLTISNNPITDISALSSLTTINWLEINFTDVSSLEPLRGNTALAWLQVAYTSITTLEPLSEVTSLQEIWFQNTEISDLAPLAGLSRMLTISAPSARISDLEPLRGLEKLDTVNVNSNFISDMSVLEAWPQIRRVGFGNQTVIGAPVLVPSKAPSYTKIDVADTFSMPFGERQTVVAEADPTNNGEGAIWRDLAEDATELAVSVSQPIVPGGPAFSARVTYPVQSADFTNSTPPAAATDAPYSFSFATTDGYVDPETSVAPAGYELSSGEVPGLSLSATGVLSGTPTQVGNHPIVVRATDRHGNTLEREYTVQVELTLGEAPQIQTQTLTGGTVGTPYTAQVRATGTAPITFTVTAGTLPAGLKLSDSGRVSGTPSTTGTSHVTISAENSVGTDSKEYRISVAPPAPACVPARREPVFADVAFGQKFYTEIDWMHCMKLSTGTPQPPAKPLYKPKDNLSREAMAAFMFRLEAPKNYTAPKVSPFADVKPGDAFYAEIVWMWEAKLSTGTAQVTGKPLFKPKDGLSREAMAAFIYRLEAPKNYTAPKVSPLADMKPGMKFYTEISWMYSEMLTTGNTVGNTKEFWPKAKLSREAMAAFIYRLVTDYRA